MSADKYRKIHCDLHHCEPQQCILIYLLPLHRIFGAKNKRLTAQELKIRREEEALFSGITGPPPTLDTLTNGHENGGADASSSPAKKRRRVARDAVSNDIDNA